MAEKKTPSLHDRIIQDIEQRILSGEWQPGHLLPFEVALAETYACSRMTVNKALTRLATAGLIERRRRMGSRVAQPRVQSAVLEIRDIESEVRSMGLSYGHVIVTRVRRELNRGDRTRIDLPTGTPLLEVVCLHTAASRPFCLEERLINLHEVPDAAEEGFETIAPGPWLLGQVPWSSARHIIRAVAADTRAAMMLHLDTGTACLMIERRTASAEGTCITAVRLTYPGISHEVAAHFTPFDGGASAA